MAAKESAYKRSPNYLIRRRSHCTAGLSYLPNISKYEYNENTVFVAGSLLRHSSDWELAVELFFVVATGENVAAADLKYAAKDV